MNPGKTIFVASRPTSGGMKVLIGTPINECKDYCMERWIKNVAELTQKTPADVVLVDNSPGPRYMEKVRGYCKKYSLTNYEILHFEIWQNQSKDEKINRAREIIRQYFLPRDYDAWFSWESDQIIPDNTLETLTRIMVAGNYTIVHPSSWTREVQVQPEVRFGVCLIRKEPLEKYGFLVEYPNMSSSYLENETLFKRHVLADGGSYIEIYGMITPIYHLNK